MSFLLKLYKYKETEKRNQLENYCTEALCYCLQHDNKFLKAFLKGINITIDSNENFKKQTQISFLDFGCRPDILLESEKTIIFVECKLESEEGTNQLERYADVLINNYQNKSKHLVYLTKYADHRIGKRIYEGISYINLLWTNLCSIIVQDGNDHFSNELKQFINATIMKKIPRISIDDLSALNNIKSILEGYDGLLNDYREKFTKKYGLNFSKSNLVNRWIKQDIDYNSIAIIYIDDCRCTLWFGISIRNEEIIAAVEFGIFTEDKNKGIGSIVEILHAKNTEVNQQEFEKEQYEGYYFAESLNSFIDKQIDELELWYEKYIDLIFTCIEKAGLKISFTDTKLQS